MKTKKKRNRNRKQQESTEIESKKAPIRLLTKSLDIPSSVLGGMCQIELTGNREAVIEGCQGVLEYDETRIKLATNQMSVQFDGRNLQLKVLTHSSAVVEGFITGIAFLTP